MIAAEAVAEKAAMDSFWDVIKNRRSVRRFKPDPVPEKDLLKIVDAARMAPCSANEQAWKFIIVRDKTTIQALKNECSKLIEEDLKRNRKLEGEALQKELQLAVDRRLTDRFTAPAFIVVLVDEQRQYPDYNSHDGPLAAGYLLLAARALGYGTVYMTDSIPEAATRKALRIPVRYKQVCVTPVGIPIAWPTQKKKKLEEFIVRESF
jgi:nitroreductase